MPIHSLIDDGDLGAAIRKEMRGDVDDDAYEDDGDEVSLSLPSFIPSTPASRHPELSSPAPGGSYLYREKGRGAGPHYQYSGPPSPGDLKRIADGRLDVFAFNGITVLQFLPDGTTEPVTEYAKSARVHRTRRRRRSKEAPVES